MGNHTDSSGLWADEWTRYMYHSDLYSDFADAQVITTYAIGVLGAACKADYPALMTSMANVGGGKYYPAYSYSYRPAYYGYAAAPGPYFSCWRYRYGYRYRVC